MPKVKRVAKGVKVQPYTPSRAKGSIESREQSLVDKMSNLMKRLPKGTFAAGGGLVGGTLGGPMGRAVGTALGSGLSAITGFGDYEVSSNSIVRQAMVHDLERSPVDDLPQFVRKDHTVNVKHREYLGDLVVPAVPTDFTNTAYTIQPSNATLFPWLARIAKQYQQYRIRGMVVEYKSNTTDYAAAGPLGSVGIATNYNVADAKFSSLVEFQNSEFAVVTKPSRNILHAIECSPALGRGEWLYVRDAENEDPAKTQDARFNDFGLLQVCTSGLPGSAGSALGQLWVSYDIEFAKPIMGTPDLVAIPGVLCVSTPDTGDLVSTASSTVLSRSWNCSAFSPTANTVYSTFLPSAVLTSTGNIAASVVAVGLAGETFTIRRPGTYFISFTLRATNTGTTGNNTLGRRDNTGQTDISVSVVGTAVYSIPFRDNKVPALMTDVGTATQQTSLSYVLNVVGANDSNYLNITPPSWQTDAVTVASITRTMTIYWVGLSPGQYVQ